MADPFEITVTNIEYVTVLRQREGRVWHTRRGNCVPWNPLLDPQLPEGSHCKWEAPPTEAELEEVRRLICEALGAPFIESRR